MIAHGLSIRRAVGTPRGRAMHVVLVACWVGALSLVVKRTVDVRTHFAGRQSIFVSRKYPAIDTIEAVRNLLLDGRHAPFHPSVSDHGMHRRRLDAPSTMTAGMTSRCTLEVTGETWECK